MYVEGSAVTSGSSALLSLVHLSCALVGLVQFLRCVLFCWAAFLSISLLISPIFFFSLSPTLLDPCATALVGQGSSEWTHFLAFMEWADDSGSRPAAWSYVTVVVGLLHGATFLSNLTLVLFLCFIRHQQLEKTLIKSLLLKKKYRTLVVGTDTY